jgi:DNA-binding transcriptional LysR family regulator
MEAPDFESIRIFLRVVERGSFTAAATQLGLPLARVSRRVRSLETQLGTQLLYRTTRRTSVTEAGRDYYELCVRAESLLQEAEQSLRARHAEPQGSLNVLLPYALGLIVLEPVLADFRRRFPKVQLALTHNNDPLDLIEHGFDIALRIEPLPDYSGYIAHSLGRSRAKLVASRSYLERYGKPAVPHDLSNHTTLAIGDDAPLISWQLTNDTGEIVDIVLKPALISNESTTVVRQVMSGAGITLLSEQFVAERLKTGTLEVVLPNWYRVRNAEISVLYPKHATRDPKVRAFVEFLREAFAPWTTSHAL